ncbi:hypothetical protein [Phenylobacterium sp.]|uniref:hypothetical protein n=1 Tax=Phenylobacterium sp. TaxID=1871053 RepID=UPI003D2BF3FB
MNAETRQLEDMRQAAFGLGMSFAEAAQVEDDLDRKLRLFDAYSRSFASVRLSIALAMRLRQEARLALRADAPQTEIEREVERDERPEPSDCAQRPERYDERDRDRETERASLPLLLRTLEQVADDARALTPQAAELPTLHELLDRVRAQPAAAKPAAAPAQAASALRTRLSGGTAALTLAPPAIRPSGLPGLPLRRSTGPPHR